MIWAGLGRMPNPRKDPPAIVVEFVSEGKRSWLRDYREKRAEYLAAGIREYWIIDRFARTMTACKPDGPDVVIPENGRIQTPCSRDSSFPWRPSYGRRPVAGKQAAMRHDFAAIWLQEDSPGPAETGSDAISLSSAGGAHTGNSHSPPPQ